METITRGSKISTSEREAHTIHSFKWYKLVDFDKHTQSYNHYHNHDIEQFHLPRTQEVPSYLSTNNPLSLQSWSLAFLDLLCVSIGFLFVFILWFLEFPVNGNLRVFCVWPLSLSMMLSKFIHVLHVVTGSFPCIAAKQSLVFGCYE